MRQFSEEALRGALLDLQRHREDANREAEKEADRTARSLLLEAYAPALKAGTIIEHGDRRFGQIQTFRGNDRGARRFEVVGTPRISTLRRRLSLSVLTLHAYPISHEGERMSGRTKGHASDTVWITVQLGVNRGHDDRRSCADKVLYGAQLAVESGG